MEEVCFTVDLRHNILAVVSASTKVGTKRLAGVTARAANADQAKKLRREAGSLNEVVAGRLIESCLLNKFSGARNLEA